MAYKILILGASYGALLGAKFTAAGHDVTLVCRTKTAALINSKGTEVRIKLRNEDTHRRFFSHAMTGKTNAATPEAVNPADYDLVCLAMQEPQYSHPSLTDLLLRIAQAKIACMSIMNMPPLPYLARIPGLDVKSLTHCFTDATVWDNFDPALVTLCSPDPQAFRPPEEPTNILQVALPTNFKVSRFDSDDHTAILRQMQADIEAIRYDVDGDSIELPVKLKVHDSIFVPLAKWCMLLTGNYRCVQKDGMRAIKDAVHSDIEISRNVYNWVAELCRAMGADAEDQVPFEKYANAALGLAKPSSAARALAAGAQNIERADCLVKTIAAQKGMQLDVIDETVAAVDGWLEKNRAQS